ncbi:MAG: hypothetical protein LBH53_02040, partial [Puniceicoccales bacterium]|nr:hypothetical protein [Puniceicoccales bacterium]
TPIGDPTDKKRLTLRGKVPTRSVDTSTGEKKRPDLPSRTEPGESADGVTEPLLPPSDDQST